MWLDGPNYWADRPCLLALLCNSQADTNPEDVLEVAWRIAKLCIQLQQDAGQTMKFHIAELHGESQVRLVFRSADRRVAQLCLQVALELYHRGEAENAEARAAQLKAIRDSVDYNALGPSTHHIVEAAQRRNIPTMRLNEGNLVQLGYGSLQQRIWTAESSQTSAIAEYVACEKPLSKMLLSHCGVPVPEGAVADTPEEAWSIAQDIGLPVVVKPTDGNHSRGVSLDLKTEHDIKKAWALANDEGSEVIVERFIPGSEHRVLVVAGKVQAVARGEIFSVRGDGQHTLEQLVDLQINVDPRRGDAEEFPLETIRFSENPLVLLEVQRQGYNPDSIPAQGIEVLVQRNGTASEDVTDLIHPSVAQACELAAKVVGLDIAGIDLVCEDIAKRLDQQAAAIVEVNAGPGLLMHLKPSKGTPRDLGTPIVESLFPVCSSGRSAGQIPVVSFSGQFLDGFGDRMASILRAKGHRTVLHTEQGMWLDDEHTRTTVSTNLDQLARRSLTSKHIDAAIFQFDADALVTTGLPYNRPSVLVVTQIECGSQGLASCGLQNMEGQRTCWEKTIALLGDDGLLILNADCEPLQGLADKHRGTCIYVSQDGQRPHTQQLIQTGHRVAVLNHLDISLYEQGQVRHTISREGPFGAVNSPLEDLCLLATTWGMAVDLAFFYVSMSKSRPNKQSA